MKKKTLQTKELSELKKMLSDAKSELPKAWAEHPVRKDKNTKKVYELRRSIAVLSGMVSGRDE